jgi:DNA mismatch endonuclease (patch repair protein)
MQRDSENNSKLEAMGFKVFRFWEQEVRNSLDCCVSQVVNYIQTR